MIKKVENILKSTMAAGASFGALVVDSMAESGRGTIDIELENGSKVTFLEFDYLDKASSSTRTFRDAMKENGKGISFWKKMQKTEYQLPNGVILADTTWIKSYDEKHENIFNTTRSFNFREDVMRIKNGKEIILNKGPEGINRGKGSLRIESDIKWPYTMASLYDIDFNSLYPPLDVFYDLKKITKMSASYYEGYYYDSKIGAMKPITVGYYAALSPSRTTMPLEKFVSESNNILEKMYPKKNGQIMTIPGLTMNKDILWELADVDVSHVQRRVRNETAKNQQPKREDAMLAASQGKTPAYTTSATMSDQVTVGLQSHADKRKAQEDAARQKRLEELMREIQAEGGSVSQTSPKKKVSGQSIVPAEAVLASTRQPKTK